MIPPCTAAWCLVWFVQLDWQVLLLRMGTLGQSSSRTVSTPEKHTGGEASGTWPVARPCSGRPSVAMLTRFLPRSPLLVDTDIHTHTHSIPHCILTSAPSCCFRQNVSVLASSSRSGLAAVWPGRVLDLLVLRGRNGAGQRGFLVPRICCSYSFLLPVFCLLRSFLQKISDLLPPSPHACHLAIFMLACDLLKKGNHPSQQALKPSLVESASLSYQPGDLWVVAWSSLCPLKFVFWLQKKYSYLNFSD